MLLPLLRLLARCTWLRAGLRSRALHTFANCAAQPHREFTVPFFGLRYRGWLDHYIDWSVFFYGAYERAEVSFLREWLQSRPRRVCLDIGANVGHHSLFFSTLFEHVHAFEPYPPVVVELHARIAMNGLGSRITVHEIGLGAADAELFFHPPPEANSGTGWFSEVHDPSVPGVYQLGVRAGDPVVAEFPHIDFIKLDCECHEVLALEGLRAALVQHRPAIVLEWNYPGSNEMRQRLLDTLPPGYTVHSLATDRPLGPFNRPSGRLVPPIWSERCTLLLEPEPSVTS